MGTDKGNAGERLHHINLPLDANDYKRLKFICLVKGISMREFFRDVIKEEFERTVKTVSDGDFLKSFGD